MESINNRHVVQEQYKTSGRLSTRISIHEKYSVNPMGFGNWVLSHYEITPGCRVLELGCGTGSMWQGHQELLAQAGQVYLTDFSAGMLETAQRTLGDPENVTFLQVDIQDIPFADASFDVVIANMMLYHVPDLNRGLAEVRRVLQDGGAFYCATYGEHGITEYLAGLLQDFGVEDFPNKTFTLQNGEAQLAPFFTQVCRQDYVDALRVTNVDDMVDYAASLPSMANLDRVTPEALRAVLVSHMEQGVLHVPKEYGMFICRK